ncbi:MAG: hypothetical protein EAZ97_02000 [Bacteroidetes bacterium]|nr:MAG: hypothetical protein EAZ97_02000 [Bacteroidota bacterium]
MNDTVKAILFKKNAIKTKLHHKHLGFRHFVGLRNFLVIKVLQKQHLLKKCYFWAVLSKMPKL